jgi:hypothetical protein
VARLSGPEIPLKIDATSVIWRIANPKALRVRSGHLLISFDCFSGDKGGLSRCLCAIIVADLFKRGLHLAAFMSGHGLALL